MMIERRMKARVVTIQRDERVESALGRDPLALERTSSIIRRHRGTFINIDVSPRRAGFRVLEHLG